MLNSSRFLQRQPDIVSRNRPVARGEWKTSHRSFQWKYTGFLIAAVFGTVSLFFAVAFFKIHQNYEIFRQLAYDTNPELVGHLEREVGQFSLFTLASLVAIFSFCLILGLGFTSNVIKPVIHLEKHMKKITRGDWSSPDFRFRSNEDLVDLLDTYAYMYRSLRAHTENEIKSLEKIAIDPNNRDSIAIWRSLINQKRAQLNSLETSVATTTPTDATVVAISPLPAARRAS